MYRIVAHLYRYTPIYLAFYGRSDFHGKLVGPHFWKLAPISESQGPTGPNFRNPRYNSAVVLHKHLAGCISSVMSAARDVCGLPDATVILLAVSVSVTDHDVKYIFLCMMLCNGCIELTVFDLLLLCYPQTLRCWDFSGKCMCNALKHLFSTNIAKGDSIKKYGGGAVLK